MANHPGRIDAIETHLSQLFLTPDRVYKLLKPVRTSFVDFTDRDDRLMSATAEFELNRRISPDVYLGTAEIIEADRSGGPQVVDRMIVMKRLPADRQLDRLVSDPNFSDHLSEVARLVASFHAGQPPVTGPAAECASAKTLARNWNDNFEVLGPMAGLLIPTDEVQRVGALVAQYLAGRGKLFTERVDQGRIRDGHGDLRCEHVFCLHDGPRLIDCLAFRDDFRIGDVLNDVAFLAMDLHRLAGPSAAKWFVERYGEFSNEHHPSSLAHHYVAYRAYVRAKVAAIRFSQGDSESAADVLTYHRLALQHLEVGQPRLILVGGGAGVGKSTIAGDLGQRLSMTWLRADEIRKDMAGIDFDQHAFSNPDTGIYGPEFTNRVYEEMNRQAQLLLEHGESVILDASWSHDQQRQAIRELAKRTNASLIELHCSAPLAVARERIARRMASVYNPSDATPEIADHLAANFDAWPEAATIDTNQTVSESTEDAYRRVVARNQNDSDRQSDAVRIEDADLSTESIRFFLSRRTRIVNWPNPIAIQ